jgi:glycosyltransferase involved in cell wall biosynthesis
MKILLVTEDLPAKMVGGLGKHVVTLGNALIAAGHDVSLMGHDAIDYAECAAEIGFHGPFIAGFKNPIRGWKERQLGFFNPIRRPLFAQRLAVAILAQSNGFDVIHYHGHLPMVGRYIPENVNFLQTRHDQGGDCITNVRFKDGGICTDLAPTACAKCIHADPGPIRTKLSAIAVARYRSEVAQAFARHPVVFVSDFLRQNFIKTMPSADLSKSHVIHNFVDEELLKQACRDTTTKADRNRVRVNVSGRIDEPKGIAALLDLLVPQMPADWHVDVYGDGPLRQGTESKHAGKSVSFYGHRLYQEKIGATLASSVVVVPSLCEEAFGMVTLEALRLGKVCYALSRGGTPELARYGAEGQLRLFNDLPTLVTALLAETDFTIDGGGESTGVEQHLQEVLSVYRYRLQKVSK